MKILSPAVLFAVSVLASPACAWFIGSNNKVVYASNCDFKGNDYASIQAPSDACGDFCASDSRCRSWAWEGSSGGTCWMKDSPANEITHPDGINCGFKIDQFKPIAPDNSASMWLLGSDGRVMYHDNCDLQGNDLYWVEAPPGDCGDYCADDSNCSHWSWSDFNGGTCWMKTGWTSTRTEVDGVHCAYAIGRFVPTTVPNGISISDSLYMLNKINSARIAAGSPPVSIDDGLTKMAFKRAQTMASSCSLLIPYIPVEILTEGYTMNNRDGSSLSSNTAASATAVLNEWGNKIMDGFSTNVGFARAIGCNQAQFWTLVLSHPA